MGSEKMTLHEAIVKVLSESNGSLSTKEIADKLNRNGWYRKKDGSLIKAFQIHGRTRNYSHLFSRDGSQVYLKDQSSSIYSNRKGKSKAKTESNIDKTFKHESPTYINKKRCPKCGSRKLIQKKDDLDITKGFLGLLIGGPIGLAAGLFMGNSTSSNICRSCRYKW